jgi:hypothetical protein
MSRDLMGKIRVRRDSKNRIYIHNNLSNGAFFFKKRIDKRLKENDLEGISFDYMAFHILTAFSTEARLNFIGYKKVRDWKEKAPFHKKFDAVFAQLAITPNWKERPFSTVNLLKKFRDLLAHGKPKEEVISENVVIDQETADRLSHLTGDWEGYCCKEMMDVVYDDMDTLWKTMLEKSGILLFETLTSSFGGMTFIENVTET